MRMQGKRGICVLCSNTSTSEVAPDMGAIAQCNVAWAIVVKAAFGDCSS